LSIGRAARHTIASSRMFVSLKHVFRMSPEGLVRVCWPSIVGIFKPGPAVGRIERPLPCNHTW
jgi:hypothetical protein